MVKDPPIPFKEGQLVETKSFIKGYRGAWFRCEITKISCGRNRVGHVLHYIDFPEEKKKWTASYEVPPISVGHSKNRRTRVSGQKKGVEMERQLMLRPPYPPIYRKDELISIRASSKTIVVIEGRWCVGDLVDMLRDGVYWCGKVTQVLDEAETMVELLPPPMGEGKIYKASMADLRPTLDWSQESGWTLPTPEGVADFHQRVQILCPEKQTVGSDLSASEEPIQCEILSEVVVDTAETTETPENMEVPLMSDNVDTVEAAIIDLEELANKLVWLKQILKQGYPLPDASSSSWEFVEHRSSMPK